MRAAGCLRSLSVSVRAQLCVLLVALLAPLIACTPTTHAPRAPEQVMALELDGVEAEARVDVLACRFAQAAHELEAVGLCRFSKRRKGTFVHRAYLPPESLH